MKKQIIPKTRNWVLDRVYKTPTRWPDMFHISGVDYLVATKDWIVNYFRLNESVINTELAEELRDGKWVQMVIVTVQDVRAWYYIYSEKEYEKKSTI
jgi:hypothetical protein